MGESTGPPFYAMGPIVADLSAPVILFCVYMQADVLIVFATRE